MTIFTDKNISQIYGDWVTTTNNGQGFSMVLNPIQDALGNPTPMSMSQVAVNFSRSGKTFNIDSTALTANVGIMNSVCGVPYTIIPQGLRFNRTLTNVTPYHVLQTDIIIVPDTTIANFSVILPAPGPANVGQIFIVKDEAGDAGNVGHNVTVTVSGGLDIDGNNFYLLNVAYESVSFYSNGTQYFTFSTNAPIE